MEFIKVGKNYMIKNSNGRIISEKEKLQLETNELIIENEKCGCSCPEKIKKVSENTKKINEIEKKSKKKNKKTALNKEVQDDTIKETDTII